MKPSFVALLVVAVAVSLQAQTGSINNTLGSGGTFKIKGSASDSLLVVKDEGKVGIGTANPAAMLDVAGQMTATQIKVDGIPSFLARHLSEGSLDDQPYTLASWDETPTTSVDVGSHDNGDNFNPSTGEFTAPRNGFYFVSAEIALSAAGTLGAYLFVKVDGDVTALTSYNVTPAGFATLNVSGVIKLSAGEVVTLEIWKYGSTGSCTAGLGYFSMYLVSNS